ncbi:ubiquitin-conjugating enzyme E2 Q2 [Pyrenophora tritici-repentis]|nr:ubiquitin-conjugating enzyme E2 Q2 [Pyrenophora tritici-repentis]KAI0609295.1 ubiquitin-conjugating enzyme E2 Q2 [Pyrenophora tritici-repentis]KAI0624929.1 ubiquitin-conjugating enzyme E2 Q2 [Pyrenophora tritici-repentis]PZD36323.1 Ubiquitin-protein ligase [Pyrenophora tritici-repentis]
MPRRQFQADLQKAAETISIAGISDVRPGGDDGEFTFMCMADGQKLQISALIPDVSDYPSSHTCMIFGADNTSASVAAALNDITINAQTVPEILELVSIRLKSTDDDGDRQMLDSQEFDEFDDEDEDEYFPGDEELLPSKPRIADYAAVPGEGSTEATAAFRKRVRNDLSTAKSQGFKVGHLGGLMSGQACYVSLAVRISKLGISEEAMQAWQVEPSEYLVAILQYPSGYRDMDEVRSYDARQARRSLGIRVGICTTYKPTISEAVAAFSVLSHEDAKRQESQSFEPQSAFTTLPTGFRNSFISRALNELLDQRFHMLLKYRYGGMPWQGAEMFYNDQVLKASHTDKDASHDKYYAEEKICNAWPKIVTDDHIISSFSGQHSLPLVAMQFVLRHFVRCTEFCLICFSKMPDDLQAIKPYVCDNPLCLYQYMSLGFGPSIEHEILSQPKVVDLLISFCYMSARGGALKDFPTGLSLAVPPPVTFEKDYGPITASYAATIVPEQTRIATVATPAKSTRYNAVTREMLFDDHTRACPVSKGHWVVIRMMDNYQKALHCRVVDASYYPAVKLSNPISPLLETYEDESHISRTDRQQAAQPQKQMPVPPPLNEFRPATYHLYDHNFDDLQDYDKSQAILGLLDLLPPIQEMREYLMRKHQSTLSAWVDRLSPAAVGILRWVIASNRACILQVDDGDPANGRKSEERLYGMSGWAQFRFAMGAPDKERRFIQAVQQTTSRLGLQYPTLFAWHGSPLKNWHTGASRQDSRPLACVDQDPNHTPRGVDGPLIIPIHAIAASRRPKAKATGVSDPQGTLEAWLNIPQKHKRQKASGKSKYDPIEIDDDDETASVATLEEDRAIFEENEEDQFQQTTGFLPTPNSLPGDKGKSKMGSLSSLSSKLFGKSSSSKPLTDYVPGTLDYSTLPMLQMPAWATSAATRRLMKDFKDLIQIQNKEPLHELGWHIDEDRVENIYQWIVELHSFEASLPLAQDMKKHGVKSIVLELRFGKDYPMSPPFVRVIRPRFLGFAQGGGGHVTAGGAMCMELLTNDGWSAVSSIESVLLQVRMAISSRDPKPARLQSGSMANYGVGEAVDAYMRACAIHGWTVPAGFREMAYGGAESASGVQGPV